MWCQLLNKLYVHTWKLRLINSYQSKTDGTVSLAPYYTGIHTHLILTLKSTIDTV